MNSFCHLFVIMIFLAAACRSSNGASNETESFNSNDSSQATPVPVATATFGSFEYLIKVTGKVRSISDQQFIAETGGRIVHSAVHTGQRVPSGLLLIQFDTVSVKYRLERAQQALYNTNKDYESLLLGYENLLRHASSEQSDMVRQKLRISSGAAGAEMDLKEARYELHRTSIVAPFSGVLADVRVSNHQYMKAGDELFRLYDPDHLTLEVNVLESDIPLIRKNMWAEVRPLTDDHNVYEAFVDYINPYVDENGMIKVGLSIITSRKTSLLFPGMNCVAILKSPVARSILVPVDAVVLRNNRAVVFSIQQGKAKWHYVETGRNNGREIEIRKGITAGDKIITGNNLQLAHDAIVTEKQNE